MTSASPSPTSQDKAIVFVVDDDVSVRESLELLIDVAGWQPETFASAEEFLAHPRVFTPNCLVLDVSLPDLNGLDLQKLVADRIEMPIIFITGHGDVPMTFRAMKAGAVEFLTKPFAEEALMFRANIWITIIDQWLSKGSRGCIVQLLRCYHGHGIKDVGITSAATEIPGRPDANLLVRQIGDVEGLAIETLAAVVAVFRPTVLLSVAPH